MHYPSSVAADHACDNTGRQQDATGEKGSAVRLHPATNICQAMDAPIKEKSAADPREYFAAEQMLLAWIRTGIALMGFGFALARFEIFINEAYRTHASGLPANEFSVWFGASLIAIGVIVNLLSASRYARLVGALNHGQFVRLAVSKQGVVVAMFLALLGITMTVYVLLVLAQPPDTMHA